MGWRPCQEADPDDGLNGANEPGGTSKTLIFPNPLQLCWILQCVPFGQGKTGRWPWTPGRHM